MRLRQGPDPGPPPERLCRFRPSEWVEPGDEVAPAGWSAKGWRRYSDARRAWAQERGLSMAQFRGLVPAPVVVYRPREEGDGAASG